MALSLGACDRAPDASRPDARLDEGELDTAMPALEPAVLMGSPAGVVQSYVPLVLDYGRGAPQPCSGVLVAPNILVTARNCIAPVPFSESFECRLDGKPVGDTEASGYFSPGRLVWDDLKVIVGPDLPPLDPAPPGDAVGAKVFVSDGNTICGHDIALVVLDLEVPGIELFPLRLGAAPVEGEEITLIGWGATDPEAGLHPNDVLLPARHAADGVEITRVFQAQDIPGSTTIGAAPRTFHTGPAICAFDNGGPALSNGALVGIASHSYGISGTAPTGFCGDFVSVYTQIAPFEDLFERAFAAAGQPIWRAGEAYPGSVEADGECVRDDNCASGLCRFVQGEGFCARPCAADADCAEGYVCGLGEEGGFCEAPDTEGCSLAPEPRGRSPIAPIGVLLAALGFVRRRSSFASG